MSKQCSNSDIQKSYDQCHKSGRGNLILPAAKQVTLG